MDRTPYILRLVDRSERFTKHHLWDGRFRGRVPWFDEQRAVIALWEQANEGPLPKGHTLLNECGLGTCVRLDHWRLVPFLQMLREVRRRTGERFLAHYYSIQEG